MINRNNCEAVFLDYYEKNLFPVEVAEVLFFLEENPDLKEVFESYEEIYLEHEKINFPDKESLKKKYSREEIDAILSSEITRVNCEQFFIANVEGILSAGGKENLNLFLLQYPELKKDFELFQQCKLSAEKISFENKSSLKKRESPDFVGIRYRAKNPVFISIFSPRTTYYAAAASILLLVGLFFFFRNNETDKPMFADKPNNGTKTIVNVKIEKSQVPSPKFQENSQQLNDEHSNPAMLTIKQSNANSQKQEIKLQPIVIEDNETLIAEKENEKPKMMEQAVIAEKKQEEKKEDPINSSQAMVAANTRKPSADEYQTLGSFARKKIRSVLGIKPSTECETSDKITAWDLAMAAKTGVQKIMGTKAVNINKICDGTGDKVEYVFAAGNFEISKSVSK